MRIYLNWFMTILITFGGWSYHIERDLKYDGENTFNENHQALGVEYEIDKKYAFGYFEFINSYNQKCRSYLAHYKSRVKDTVLFFGVRGGFIDGYKRVIFKQNDGSYKRINYQKSEIFPVIFPTMTLKNDYGELEFSFVTDGTKETTLFLLLSKLSF